jgi:hypothetical protein
MNSLTIAALVILALVATASYFYGTKKNRWIASVVSKELEKSLKPITSNYVNIGGNIGYNFTYALSAPYTNARGTFTMSPRHSLLYLPFSLLLGIRDRFFINVFTKSKIRGEGHVVQASYLKKANIAGIDEMERRETEKDGKRFVLLWKGADLSSELEKILESLPDPIRLRHFCAYPENKTFFIHFLPKDGIIQGNLEPIILRLPVFMVKEK